MKEVIFVILLAGGMLGTSAIAGQWWLFSVFAVFFVCFGVIEAIAVNKTGKSVSQKFWAYGKAHPVGKWIVLAGMLLSWLSLLWHLAGCAPVKKEPNFLEFWMSPEGQEQSRLIDEKCCTKDTIKSCDMQCMMEENKRLLK